MFSLSFSLLLILSLFWQIYLIFKEWNLSFRMLSPLLIDSDYYRGNFKLLMYEEDNELLLLQLLLSLLLLLLTDDDWLEIDYDSPFWDSLIFSRMSLRETKNRRLIFALICLGFKSSLGLSGTFNNFWLSYLSDNVDFYECDLY